MNKRRKILVSLAIAVTATVLLLIILLSPIAKALIQKYDTRYTGREITLDWAYVNPFTGYIYLNDLKIFEYKSDSVFFSTRGLSANFSLFGLFSEHYRFKGIKLSEPVGRIHESDSLFNFSDLILTFSGDSTSKESDGVLMLDLLDIEIENGEFHYLEDMTPVNYYIKEVNIKSEGYRYDSDTLPFTFSFLPGIGSGKMEGEMAINVKNSAYVLKVKIDSFDLEIINQYLLDLTNYGTFAAKLDADLESTGYFATADSTTLRGRMEINHFEFGRTREDDFASFEQLRLNMAMLSPKDFIYTFDSVYLKKPFFKYQQFDSLDNVQTTFGEGGENVKAANKHPTKFNLVIEIAHLVDKLSRNFLRSQYEIGSLEIKDGDFQYEDYSLGEKLSLSLDPFSLVADSVEKSRDRVNASIRSGIKPYGDFMVDLSIDPRDSSYFDLHVHLTGLALTMLNPYLLTYSGFPLDRGSMEFHGDWKVNQGQIRSTNHLLLIDPRIDRHVRGADKGWLPMKLAMALLREKGNVIDYEIPITGKLGDPHFNLWDVFTDILTNIVVKPASTGYRVEVRKLEKELERSQRFTWAMGESKLTKGQENYIKKMIRFLKNDPEAMILISPKHFEDKEKELILLFEAKKRYYLHKHKKKETGFSSFDSVQVTYMSIKDPGFLRYLNLQVKDKTLFTVQEKAILLIGSRKIEAEFQKLIKARENGFKAAFKEENVIGQLTWKAPESLVPFNGFSYFEIMYQLEFPDYLMKAYEKMEELDNKRPREAYKRERKRNELKE